MFADIVHAHHLLAHPVLQRLDDEEAGGRDADGDMYYGGSMYYGNGKVEGAGAVRTWFANVAKCESAVSPDLRFYSPAAARATCPALTADVCNWHPAWNQVRLSKVRPMRVAA